MLLKKRITKLGKNSLAFPQEASERIPPTTLSTKAQKITRCRFKHIPQNSKFTIDDPIYPILGDIPLREAQNSLSMDISFYNHFKLYRHITVNDFFGEKIIMIRPTPKNDNNRDSQLALVKRLDDAKCFDRDEWTRVIRTFYQKYDKVMKRQSRKKGKCEVRKKFYAKITAKTVQKKKELYEKFPCLELQFRIRNHENQLSEIIFSEKFIKELGYSDESFISTVLNEGIPPLLCDDNRISVSDAPFSSEIKLLIDNYFQISDDGSQAPENQATLMLKSGFVKDINYLMHVLMNYEANTFGIDVIIAIISKSEPYLPKQENLTDKLNENFIRDMIAKESEAEYFLSAFYNETLQKRYTNMDKTCQVKEIPAQQ